MKTLTVYNRWVAARDVLHMAAFRTNDKENLVIEEENDANKKEGVFLDEGKFYKVSAKKPGVTVDQFDVVITKDYADIIETKFIFTSDGWEKKEETNHIWKR